MENDELNIFEYLSKEKFDKKQLDLFFEQFGIFCIVPPALDVYIPNNTENMYALDIDEFPEYKKLILKSLSEKKDLIFEKVKNKIINDEDFNLYLLKAEGRLTKG